MKSSELPLWEILEKRQTLRQLGEIREKRVLDFGSGNGAMASFLGAYNEVVAIEPDLEVLQDRDMKNNYTQICGGVEKLAMFPEGSFDVVLCHNVLEYAEDREQIVAELERVLTSDGVMSIVKHNLAGRIMQMAVLLNKFDEANALIDGEGSVSEKYGRINYYADDEVASWGKNLKIEKTFGQRMFWGLQQNQEIQKSKKWQAEMIAIEDRLDEASPFFDIAFFHHLVIKKTR